MAYMFNRRPKQPFNGYDQEINNELDYIDNTPIIDPRMARENYLRSQPKQYIQNDEDIRELRGAGNNMISQFRRKKPIVVNGTPDPYQPETIQGMPESPLDTMPLEMDFESAMADKERMLSLARPPVASPMDFDLPDPMLLESARRRTGIEGMPMQSSLGMAPEPYTPPRQSLRQRAEAELGDYNSPGLGGRLKQSAMAFLTGGGLGGAAAGLFDLYGKQQRQQDLASTMAGIRQGDQMEMERSQIDLANRKQEQLENYQRQTLGQGDRRLGLSEEIARNNKQYRIDNLRQRAEMLGKRLQNNLAVADKRFDATRLSKLVQVISTLDPNYTDENIINMLEEETGKLINIPGLNEGNLNIARPGQYGMKVNSTGGIVQTDALRARVSDPIGDQDFSKGTRVGSGRGSSQSPGEGSFSRGEGSAKIDSKKAAIAGYTLQKNGRYGKIVKKEDPETGQEYEVMEYIDERGIPYPIPRYENVFDRTMRKTREEK